MNFQYPVTDLRKMYTALRIHYRFVKRRVRNPSRCIASCLLIHMQNIKASHYLLHLSHM